MFLLTDALEEAFKIAWQVTAQSTGWDGCFSRGLC